MNRWDVINKFIQERGYESYLEIGYYKGWSFDQVNCKNKTAVDPNPSKSVYQEEAEHGRILHQMHASSKGIKRAKIIKLYSDEFFSENEEKFDIVFIDGLHEAPQVQRDVINALKVLNKGGVVLLHDCNPPTEEHTLGGVDGCWNGDVYKALMVFKLINPNVYTIDTDWGIGVIEKFDIPDVEIVNELEWKDFYPHSIGLISLNEFNKSFEKKHQVKKEEVVLIEEASEIKAIKPIKATKVKKTKAKRELVFMCVQPADELRWSFQVEIFIENTIKMGYTNEIHILMYIPPERVGRRHARFTMLEERYKQSAPNIKFFWYEDSKDEVLPLARVINYTPLLRPWTLKQHFIKFPELSKKAIFYHDNDIVFTRHLDFTPFLDDDINYLSRTDYLDATYFDSKSKHVMSHKLAEYQQIDVLDTLAKMNGITRQICVENDKKTGGAQTLLKNIDAQYWDDVFNSILTIRPYLWYDSNGINAKFFRSENDGFQSWCADMWAVLWNLWKRGFKTETPKELEFAWATDVYKKLERVNIYHDAGVTSKNDSTKFNKNKHIYIVNGGLQLPYVEDFGYVDKESANYFYVQEIEAVRKKYNY